MCCFCFVVSAFAAFGVRTMQLYSHIGGIARPKWQRMNIYKLCVVFSFCCVASVVKSVVSVSFFTGFFLHRMSSCGSSHKKHVGLHHNRHVGFPFSFVGVRSFCWVEMQPCYMVVTCNWNVTVF